MNLQQLINKATSDKKFFEQLKSDPEGVLSKQGEKPTPQQIAALKKVNYNSLVDVATAFDGSGNIT